MVSDEVKVGITFLMVILAFILWVLADFPGGNIVFDYWKWMCNF